VIVFVLVGHAGLYGEVHIDAY